MLRKTGSPNLSRSNPTSPDAVPSLGGRQPIYCSNNNSNKKNRQSQIVVGKAASNPTTPRSEKSPAFMYCQQGPAGPGYYPTADSSSAMAAEISYFPLPGLANAFPSRARSPHSETSDASTVVLSPGIIFEGEEEIL